MLDPQIKKKILDAYDGAKGDAPRAESAQVRRFASSQVRREYPRNRTATFEPLARAAERTRSQSAFHWNCRSHPVDPGTEGPSHPVRSARNRQDLLGGTYGMRLGCHGGVWQSVPGSIGGRETGHHRHGSAARLGALVLFSRGIRIRGFYRRLSARDGQRSPDIRTCDGSIQATVCGRPGCGRSTVLPDH